MKLDTLFEAVKNTQDYPEDVKKKFNKVKSKIGNFMGVKFSRIKKGLPLYSNSFFEYKSKANTGGIDMILELKEDRSKAEGILSVSYTTDKTTIQHMRELEEIVEATGGHPPGTGGTWYGKGKNSTYFKWYFGNLEKEKVEKPSKPSAQYDPEKEYYDRRNPTQRAADRARSQHQFADSIGGDSSNYR